MNIQLVICEKWFHEKNQADGQWRLETIEIDLCDLCGWWFHKRLIYLKLKLEICFDFTKKSSNWLHMSGWISFDLTKSLLKHNSFGLQFIKDCYLFVTLIFFNSRSKYQIDCQRFHFLWIHENLLNAIQQMMHLDGILVFWRNFCPH